MWLHVLSFILVLQLSAAALAPVRARAERRAEFPAALVSWQPAAGNPVFTAGGPGHWDVKIRERGWILRDGNHYSLWFTGYDGTKDGIRQLGYATSPDGVHWTRSPKNPLVPDYWVEDVMVVKCHGTYYMFSEGPEANHAEMLTSKDGVDWKWRGPLDVRLADGKTPAKRPCGTPTIWIKDDVWYLFYEIGDKGIWLARSRDPNSRVWTNVLDEPVLLPGPGDYDKDMIALNQVIKQNGTYYAFYHGSGLSEPRTWNTNIARSKDLIHWEKFAGNPIVDDNKSSGIVVPVGGELRLFTMHDQVDVFAPSSGD